MGVSGERDGCAASRMWRSACGTLVAPDADEAWQQVAEASPSDSMWHSLRNCVSYQAGVWQNLLMKGMVNVMQPAAFKLAIVLRHTPTDLTVRLLTELLRLHPQSQDLTAYILALLTDDEAWCGRSTWDEGGSETGESESSAGGEGDSDGDPGGSGSETGGDDSETGGDAESETGVDTGGEAGGGEAGGGEAGGGESDGGEAGGGETVGGAAPLRDLQLFGDCELAVLAASREEYDAHAKLVRAEYSKLSQQHYVELRVKVLNQFSQIPKLYHTAEFECFEAAARENIEREICTLREHLLSVSRISHM